MLITDYSNQEYSDSSLRAKPAPRNFSEVGWRPHSSDLLPELLTAGMIFILPIIFLLIITAS